MLIIHHAHLQTVKGKKSVMQLHKRIGIGLAYPYRLIQFLASDEWRRDILILCIKLRYCRDKIVTVTTDSMKEWILTVIVDNKRCTLFFNRPFGSTNFTGLFAQYTYGLSEGYLSLIGSTLSQMLRSLV